jgi:Holliday junction DNA helicase RuvB
MMSPPEKTPQRIVGKELLEEDRRYDQTLRPHTFSEYIGQERIKDNLQVYIEAARGRQEPLDHCLFYGPPGLGKTTLAYIISTEMQVNIRATSGPAIERAGDLAAILTNLQENDILFIDEIHRLSHVVEEILYPAMEDFQLDIIIGQGPHARSVKLTLPRFTLIGATTRAGLITSPLRDRFGVVHRLDYYREQDIESILHRAASIMKISLSPEGASVLAGRSRGTPRVANRLLRRVRDFAEVWGNGTVTDEVAKEALSRMEIDDKGFEEMDRRILLTIIEKFAGGPVGLETLAAAVGEEKETIEDVYEPYLMQLGYLARTPRGRIVTRLACEHFGLAPPRVMQEELF